MESQAGGGNPAGSGPQTPGCPLQLESETHQNRYFHMRLQLDEKNFSQGKGVNDNVWTLCGRCNLNRKKRYIRHQHQTESANRWHSAKCRWKVAVVVGAVEPAVGEGLQGQGG